MMSWRPHRIGLLLASWLALPMPIIAQVETASEKITRAATTSHELAELAATLPTEDDPAAKVPFESHIRRYIAARPWASQGMLAMPGVRATNSSPEWPTPADAPALHVLLKDESPPIRGIAAEVLAILQQPEDAPRLAELLDDATASAPLLGGGWWTFRTALPADGNAAATDALDWSRTWQQRTVAAYAKDGLKQITGRDFSNKSEFQKWWPRNSDARHCLWYWQLRIQQAMAEVEHRPDLNIESAERAKQLTAARTTVARRIQAELKQLPPEIEAKVRLLATSSNAGGAPITGAEELFWPEAPQLRLPPERLLELLDRKNLWPDVDWDGNHYNLLAERLGMWADVLFKPQHAGRLRTALKREKDELWWSGQAALVIGIARLHPAAKPGKLDETGTRDQILRHAAVNESDLFVRSYCAMELVRVGLPENAAFLQRIAFEPTKDSGSPDVMKGIIQALARPPLDKPKLQLLADIVLDERFKDSWTRRNAQMGDDMNRTYAIWAINAHAGRTLITDEQRQNLVDPATSASTLEKVRADIRQLLGKP